MLVHSSRSELCCFTDMKVSLLLYDSQVELHRSHRHTDTHTHTHTHSYFFSHVILLIVLTKMQLPSCLHTLQSGARITQSSQS